jgi:trypsin
MGVSGRILTTIAAGVFTLLGTLPATAQHNWMKEVVDLRVAAFGARLGLADTGIAPRIVGGTFANPNSNPFQVALLNKAIANNFAAFFCGGSLYKPDIVITAAHCSDIVTAANVQVLTGTRALNGTGVRRDVVAIRVHPRWNPGTNDFDVAIWKLASNAPGPLVLLAPELQDPPIGTPLLATGWGALTEGGGGPVFLRQAILPLVSRANCNDANSYNGAITPRMLCAGFNGGGRDTCQGDSGGPLTSSYSPGANRSSILTGVVSFGIGCARPNLFGVYARVSNPLIRNFIINNSN